MSPESGEVYVMRATDEEWVAPTPITEAITEALTAATDLEEADLRDTDYDIDHERLRQLIDGSADGERTVTIEGYEVTIDATGEITVER
ncbi:hypothetical protein GRX03_01725 [Halovenus sp. WSH3]|uniref:Halobacterial output domain-containing protein n=1 Tax=Halovenus carboxidivorans TaxID=2692199 RepID=A0A6B0TAX6_9EURY|nr:HalOD1 output domain-containing protein [Halovenus carboxidivorans]MXR50329.1 hypothetical protein [Halovenus carboxidivorans]